MAAYRTDMPISRRHFQAAAGLGALRWTAAGAAGLLGLQQAYASPPEEGFEYQVLATAAPRLVQQGVEVIEFFRYGCPFCNRLEPLLQAWKPRLPAHAQFHYLPVSFHSTAHQQLYLTLKHLGQDARLHTQVYNTIHTHGKSLEMLMEISEWAASHGIPVATFEAAWHSPQVAQAMQQSNDMLQAYGVTGVPVFGVGGRFVTSPAMVGGSNARALEVVEYLVGRANA
jgi:thiol:disulfide interchange protein DsbA